MGQKVLHLQRCGPKFVARLLETAALAAQNASRTQSVQLLVQITIQDLEFLESGFSHDVIVEHTASIDSYVTRHSSASSSS